MLKAQCCPESSLPALPDSTDEQLAQLATALGHPARVAIIRLLKERETCICGEIVEVLPLAQSTVSQHLKVLKQAGWIQGEVDGPRTCYCLNPLALEKFQSLIQSL
jgi:ArsR family transcriptional regulator